MEIKTNVKAGKLAANHNTTVQTAGTLKVRTGLKAGKHTMNHNVTVR